jgi:hypothetical protein
MKSKYVYKEPAGEKHIISIRKWNKVFVNGGTWPFVRVEVFVRDTEADCHYVVSPIGKLIVLLGAPVFYLIGTFSAGFSEAHEDIKRILFNKSKGAFSSDRCWKGSKDWEKLMKLIGKE